MNTIEQRARELLREANAKYGNGGDASIAAIVAALASQAQVPEGFVLVPKRATDAMTDAGCLALAGSLGGYEAGQVYMCWEAMIAAATAPESP